MTMRFSSLSLPSARGEKVVSNTSLRSFF